jgi:hypothetical protein
MPRGLSARRASISGVALALALVLALLVGSPAQAANGTLAGSIKAPDGSTQDFFRVDVYRETGSGTWQIVAQPTFAGNPVGEFAVSLPPGTYRACFTALTFESIDDSGRGCWQGAYDVWGATDIVIVDGGTTIISPQLPLEAKLRGRIVGGNDGVGVSSYVAPYRKAPDGTWEQVFGEQSNADGTFVLDDLDPGTYRFCVLDVPREFLPECWRDQPTVATADEVVVPEDGVVPIRLRLARRANISGTVTRPPGVTSPVGVLAYWWRNARWEPVSFASAGPDGGYRITGLDADTYRVCAHGFDVVTTCWRTGSQPDDATDIAIATGQYRRYVDLAPTHAGYVSGTLPDVYLGAQGYPVPTAYRLIEGEWVGVASGDAVPTGIGNNWDYQIGSLPTGKYVVCIEHAEPEFVTAFPRTCTGGSPSPQAGDPVEVVAGATTSGIDIVTGQAGEIRGGVSGATGPVRVDLYAPTGRLAMSTWTGPNDWYHFTELPAGDYRVGFHRTSSRSSLAAEWWQNKGDAIGPAGATPVTVDGAIVAGIRATLDPGGTIDGRLLDSAGSPVDGCVVRARARDGSLAVRTAVTDAAGDFSIGGLSTASYVVVVAQACSGTPTGIFYDAGSPDGTTGRLRNADDVAVTRGLTTTLAVDLHTDG